MPHAARSAIHRDGDLTRAIAPRASAAPVSSAPRLPTDGQAVVVRAEPKAREPVMRYRRPPEPEDGRHGALGEGRGGPDGADHEGTSRDEVVDRMLALLDQAIEDHVELIAYPEMALTTYFPSAFARTYDQFFETEVPAQGAGPCCAAPARPAWRCTWASARRRRPTTSTPALLTTSAGRWPALRKIHIARSPLADGVAQVYEVGTSRPATPAIACSARQGARRHRHLPGPALSGELIAASASAAPRSSDRLQHAALADGARPERAGAARGRLRNSLFVVGHRQGRRGGRARS